LEERGCLGLKGKQHGTGPVERKTLKGRGLTTAEGEKEGWKIFHGRRTLGQERDISRRSLISDP